MKVIRIFFILMLLSCLLFELVRDFDVDEFEALHTSWKIVQGEVIYKSFFQHHHPFLYYLIAPVIILVGENITTLLICRVLLLFIGVGIIYYTYRMAFWLYKEKQIALISTTLLLGLFPFVINGFQIRPDTPMVLFQLMAIYHFFQFVDTHDKLKLLISSVCLGVSFLFLQKAIVFIGIVFCLCMWNINKRLLRVPDFLLYVCGFLVVIFSYYIFLFGNNMMEKYFLLNWVLNAKMLPIPYFYPLKWIFLAISLSIIAIIFFVWGLYSGRSIYFQKQISFLSISLIAALLLYPLPWPQYVLPALPYMAIIGGYAFNFIYTNSRRVAIILMMVMFLIESSFFVSNIWVYPVSKQIDNINYVLSVTGKNDYVLEGNHIRTNLFRKDVDYFWFQTAPNYGALCVYKKLTGYYYDPVFLVEKYRPKIINIELFNNLAERHHISENYRPTGIDNMWERID